jgi:putative ABC transport system substrate-binding protein
MTLLGGAAMSWPLAARAQQGVKVYRVGFLWDSPAVFAEAIEAFQHGLREQGWNDGRNITIEYRWAEGRPERMRELAEELVRLKVDIIVVPSSIYTEAAKRATSTIPIICVSHAAPIESGHVDSLARPGGNITGLLSCCLRQASKAWNCSTISFPASRALGSSGTPPLLRTGQACVLWNWLLQALSLSFKLCRCVPRRNTMTPLVQ